MSEGDLPVASLTSETLQLTHYSSVAALTLILWDACITIEDEVTYIWPKPRGAYIKWLYLFGKYFTLTLQTGTFFLEVIFIANNPRSDPWCHVYRGIQGAEIYLLLIILDVVLIVRIYALYGRNKWVMLLCALALLAECVSAVPGNTLVFSRMVYDPACMMVTFPRTVILLVSGTLVSQTALLWLAYRKKATVIRAERGRTSIASNTIRDGVVAFICIAALFLVLLGSQLGNSASTNMSVPWFPVCISIATCRLIMNLQRASFDEDSQEFTTEIWRPEYELETCSRAL